MTRQLSRLNEAKQKINSVRGRSLTIQERVVEAEALASLLLSEASLLEDGKDKQQHAQLARMMNDPKGKAFTIQMADTCFRSNQPKRIADQLNEMIRTMGVPRYLSKSKRMGLHLFKYVSKWLPSLCVPLLKKMLRKETASLILPGESEKLSAHIRKRHREGIRINLNHIGEAILGEQEAQKRLQTYLDDLANPEIDYISIKISTVYSQINTLAREKTIQILAGRIRQLFRQASLHPCKQPNGETTSKFVNLDMEEYRDLRLTVDVFKMVLSEPEFRKQSAGIVLQSYLPDSFPIQKELTEWAFERVREGGAPIKIRIVKGANLAMEQVEASLKEWEQAPYTSKKAVDANFKQMLHYGMRPENAHAVHLGIASHNLFDIAYACLLSAENKVEECVGFEMLEGMADHIRQVVQQLTGKMLLYCPVAKEEEFQYALAYLIRRLDENTAPQNFLRHIFGLKFGSQDWQNQAQLFAEAASSADVVDNSERRLQNRLLPPFEPESSANFSNEPDTDWSLVQNQQWARNILEEWEKKTIPLIPLVIGEDSLEIPQKGIGKDPSYPTRILYEYCLADEQVLNRSLDALKKAQKKWEAVSIKERSTILQRIAQAFRVERGALIGAMVAATGKTVFEADVEVSEAIDFAEYYRRNIEELSGLQDINWKSKGVVLVAPPWNFPCSIPAGCILAALATGNGVLFKPAPEAVLVGWELVNLMWRAGVSKEVLHFVSCEDTPTGTYLIKDPRIDCVLLTGATETAELFLKMRPQLDLIAETGGKNSIIVSAAADRDLAIKEIIQSAFGHAGQKCSACSLAILEAEVYNDPHFKQQLSDAVSSLIVGSPWDLATKVNPLIRPPNEALKRALTSLEDGEEWVVQPISSPSNSHLWSPGIKWGVKPDSFTHQTEFFGPVLGVMKADNITHAIELANGTRYGLTAGIHTLDEREKQEWLQNIEAGNCYINRGITGAIVQRQPFGGCKASSFGSGAKAGGPNYLMQLLVPEQLKLPTEREKLDEMQKRLTSLAEKSLPSDEFIIWQASLGSYCFFWQHYFCKDHDSSLLVGQDNLFRYRPYKGLCIRIRNTDALLDFWRITAVAAALKSNFQVSVDPSFVLPWEDVDTILPEVFWEVETDEEWLTRIDKEKLKKVRLLSNPPVDILSSLANSSIRLSVSPIYANGRIELLKYLREISISSDYHRYGNLGLREQEKRASRH